VVRLLKLPQGLRPLPLGSSRDLKIGQTVYAIGNPFGLSRTLNVRTEYFFRPEPVALEGIEYRKRSSLPKKRLDAITHEVIDLIERRIELENLFPQSPVKAFATVDGLASSITVMDQIEEAAERVREAWDLGFDPIPDLIDVLETNGIRVFMIEADAENKFDGLAARVSGMPIVVVGRHWPGDRQRFTLAHELGQKADPAQGGQALVDLIVEHSHTCYLGERTQRHDWGYGCGQCPACQLRASGFARYCQI
jgi:hypothetical protein